MKKIIKWSAIALVIFFVLMVIIGASSGGKNNNAKQAFQDGMNQAKQAVQTTPTHSVVYTVSVQAKAFNSSSLEVSGSTNLPDGAIISIKATRIETLFGENEERFPIIGQGESIAQVDHGTYITKVQLDDQKLLDYLKTSGDQVKKMDTNVAVTADFYPALKGQTKDVLNAVGINGENLASSPQKTVFGSLTKNPENVLEAAIRTPLPFPYMNQLSK